MNKEKLREELAELCHDQWRVWMDGVFSHTVRKPFGGELIEGEDAKRWNEHALAPYSRLGPVEKQSRRVGADRFVELIEKHMEKEDELY